MTTVALSQQAAKVEKLSKSLDDIVPADATIKKVAEGFTWTEGPVWIYDQVGYLLFADIPGNAIYKLIPGRKPTVFIHPSGWNEATPFKGKEPGSNGMTLDSRLRLTVAGHANRNVWRLETMSPKAKVTILADSFEGKKLNSPNDLVYKRDHSLYFTDPPYGLPKGDDDPAKELKFNGVFRYANGKLQAIVKDLSRPNGIAFSPDEKILYISNSDEKRRIWMRYDVNADGTVSNGRVFADATADPETGLPDGMKVDSLGNLYSSAPGGIWVFSPDGKHIGTIKPGESPANCAWAEDGKTLYITATTSVYRIKLAVTGEKALYQ